MIRPPRGAIAALKRPAAGSDRSKTEGHPAWCRRIHPQTRKPSGKSATAGMDHNRQHSRACLTGREAFCIDVPQPRSRTQWDRLDMSDGRAISDGIGGLAHDRRGAGRKGHASAIEYLRGQRRARSGADRAMLEGRRSGGAEQGLRGKRRRTDPGSAKGHPIDPARRQPRRVRLPT